MISPISRLNMEISFLYLASTLSSALSTFPAAVSSSVRFSSTSSCWIWMACFENPRTDLIIRNALASERLNRVVVLPHCLISCQKPGCVSNSLSLRSPISGLTLSQHVVTRITFLKCSTPTSLLNILKLFIVAALILVSSIRCRYRSAVSLCPSAYSLASHQAISFRISASLRYVSSNPGVSRRTTDRPSILKR